MMKRKREKSDKNDGVTELKPVVSRGYGVIKTRIFAHRFAHCEVQPEAAGS
jgi:hypothetical protein